MCIRAIYVQLQTSIRLLPLAYISTSTSIHFHFHTSTCVHFYFHLTCMHFYFHLTCMHFYFHLHVHFYFHLYVFLLRNPLAYIFTSTGADFHCRIVHGSSLGTYVANRLRDRVLRMCRATGVPFFCLSHDG